MAENSLLTAAGRIADGEPIDWVSITATLPSEEDRAIADELALVAQIAAGHRQLHQLLPVAADTPPNLIPDRARWGHLDLLNIVGRGSYGTVYRAWDTRLERLVALKLFHGASNPDAVIQEGRMLARMRHENVVSVYGADVLDGVAGIWMELVHGRTLDNIVKTNGAMSAPEAAAVGVDIAKALATVHAAGLLHCDVKAQNVVRESGGRVVLMDLGAGRLAPEMHDGDQVSDVAGTPRYMAPELFEQGAAATRASDLYSFGVMLYFLLSARFPVDGKTLGEMRKAHQDGKTRGLGEVCGGLPADLVALITKALDRDPAKRPESAAEMQTSLATVASAQVEPDATPSVLRWAAIATVALPVLAAVLWVVRSPSPVLPSANTLAVMQITNFTGDPSKQYLADGLTEVLVAHLARLPGLQVASSATMSTVRGMTDEREIAEKLGVRLLLAGSVLQAGDRIVLSVRLTDPHSGRVIWGSQLERAPSNILGARSEIASLVAARLAIEVPRSGTNEGRQLKADAQDAFIRGVVEAGSDALPRVAEAVRLFERAIALEPDWAEPLAYLAYAQQISGEFGNPAKRAERAEIVRANALRAVELDPQLSMSYTALAAVQAYHDWDVAAAERTLRQGIEAFPRGAIAHARLALLLAATGRLPEAVMEAERARDLEPLIPERHTTLGITRYYARDFDRALQEMQRALAISPGYAAALFGSGRVLSAAGRHEEAIRNIRSAIELSTNRENPAWLAGLVIALSRAGHAEQVEEVMPRLRLLRDAGVFVSVDNFAYIAANQGRLDEAFELLDEALERRMTNVLWLAVDPWADPLRSDPRLDNVIARMGLVTK